MTSVRECKSSKTASPVSCVVPYPLEIENITSEKRRLSWGKGEHHRWSHGKHRKLVTLSYKWFEKDFCTPFCDRKMLELKNMCQGYGVTTKSSKSIGLVIGQINLPPCSMEKHAHTFLVFDLAPQHIDKLHPDKKTTDLF